MKNVFVAIGALVALAGAAPGHAAAPSTTAGLAIPSSFESKGADRAAIQALLDTYTTAVTSKNEPLFASLLLGPDIPFSYAPPPWKPGTGTVETRNFADFRKDVFEGPPFAQRFRDVHIYQDGPLAAVTLVFVNTSKGSSGWGWKTLQLLKVDGRWKIASEFYTYH